MVLNTEWAQVEVIDLINDGTGLAFGIIGGRSTGVVVKTILPGGVADRDGRLQSGDHILQIGEVNLRGLGSEQVASVLRQCGVHVRMVVARPVESTTADYQALGSNAPIVPTKILGDPVELDRHLIENGYIDTQQQPPPSNNYTTRYILNEQNDIQLHPISGIVDVVKRNPLPIGIVPEQKSNQIDVQKRKMLPLDMALHEPNLPETETLIIELHKDDLGLGITVAGYVCEKEEISGIFVKSISKGSVADLTKSIKINDRIIEVDGKSLVGFTNHQAVELLRNTGPIVQIKVERYLRGPKYEHLQQAIKANDELRPPSLPSPSVSSLQKVPLSLVHMSYLGIEPEGESRTSVDFDSSILLEQDGEREIVIGGEEIMKQSMQISCASHETIYDKWREKLDKDVEIVIAEIHKEPTSGLGISLEGTVDVEDGKEVRPHHYIRNILPDGPIGKNAILKSGDELLEVNGIQLFGLNHLEVVTILKQLTNYVCLVCARNSVPIRIIDTAQHKEAFQQRKIIAGSLQTLIPSPTNEPNQQQCLVKAKSETSICSSINNSVQTPNRSRSLELVTGIPMWSEQATIVELNKGDYGLGFSILDYQDPLNPEETVIVIRSLVPGGVAQLDGQLIPGDRLLAVNDVNVEHATLDRAVQVLKGTPKGIVKISVAKPLNTNDVSHTSQDTEDDQTCLDDFQECLEEYQECLEVVHICIDEDTPFNNSPCTSQVEDFGQDNKTQVDNNVDFLENNYITVKLKETNHCCEENTSDLDTTTTVTTTIKKDLNNCLKNNNNFHLIKADSLTQSDNNQKVSSNQTQSSNLSEKDGYETCIDESLSEDSGKQRHHNQIDELKTPTNTKNTILPSVNNNINNNTPTVSDPVNEQDEDNDDEEEEEENREDEFFLVQYPPKDGVTNIKFFNTFKILPKNKIIYRRSIKEYYNDYKDCLELYNIDDGKQTTEIEDELKIEKFEMCDDDIFNEILLPFKSHSTPNIMDSSFVTLTYDPGPGLRRKSAFLPGENSEMTVIRPIENDFDGNTLKIHQHVDNMLEKHWGSTHTIQVYREINNKSLGISIVGGKVDLQQQQQQLDDKKQDTILGIFIKNVVDDSPAGRTGKFKTGDRILEVSGIDLRQATHEIAVEAIRNAPNPVTFVVQSINPWKTNDCVENQCQSPFPSPASVKQDETLISNEIKEETDEKLVVKVETKMESDEDDDDEDEDDDDDVVDFREMAGRTISAKGQQIDRSSAANLRRSKEEIDLDDEDEDEFGYTLNKVKKKYANLGHKVLMVQLERSSSHQGLGISLAGHKDRNCMAVFVCGLNPNGAAFKTGGIQIGDEILEVNGVVLHGRCHLNASAIIKGLSGPIFKVILLRRKAAIDDIAVKPITQFPVSLAEEATEEQFCTNYPNVRTVSIKKGSQSLGIMIIEGKHTEVGQGIFISDIQEGSSAQKAGLEIGEMILAVNKDTLVGSNYEMAANLLKRTEGLVTLVVSNPSKKDATIQQKQKHYHLNNSTTLASNNTLFVNNKTNALTAPTQLSRPTTPVPELADPTTSQITPGKETIIELVTDNKGLGIFFIGGKDTINNGIIIVEIYPGGMADKDGRLKSGDQILDVNGTSLKDCTQQSASQALRQTLPKMKLTIYRPNTVEYSTLDVDLIKKPGKGLGLSIVARKTGKGVYISDIINGGTADIDGRIIKGDILVQVNGQNIENASGEEAGAILKTVMGKVTLKLHRYKLNAR